MRVYVEGVGLCGPGLDGWETSRAVLAGGRAYAPAPTLVPPSLLLPPNERRRAALIVRLALAVGAEAFAATAHDPAQTASVFTSSGGDGDTIHAILSTLASPERALSPTRFHNSVHNASSGYWSIASRSRAASTSLCCEDDSFAAGLLEAVAQAVVAQRPVALIAYDAPYPFPLSQARPIGAAFAVALLLSPAPSAGALARVDLVLSHDPVAPTAAPAGLEALRRSTPAARGLPLLAALAGAASSVVQLGYLDDMALALTITPMQTAA